MLAALPVPALASDFAAWHCWYDADGKFQLTCALPDDDFLAVAIDGANEGGAIRARWRRALQSNELALAARLVRDHPVEFAARRMYIPLYGPPASDLRQAERLARAVTCRRQPACVVAFDPLVRIRPAD
jgi:hypothetical protein